MSLTGLALCARYSYPPNSLSLCGPDNKNKQTDLSLYSSMQMPDKGTLEILSQFSTLYPYLSMIANDNNIADPFDLPVVEAYWLGNHLLQNVRLKSQVKNLGDNLKLKKKLTGKTLQNLFQKVEKGALPHHSFHVMNIYKRTGLADTDHTIQTMDACIINCGKVTQIDNTKISVDTKPLILTGDKLVFGPAKSRTLMFQGKKDVLSKNLRVGDWVSYHWGYFCEKLDTGKLRNLIYYTKLSLDFANFK